MHRQTSAMRTHPRTALGALMVVVLLLSGSSSAPAAALDDRSEWPTWEWPLQTGRAVDVPYRAPAHEYGAGHRGIDIPAALGVAVYAPADGVVAFRGRVVDRALLTIEHSDGLVTTFEPLLSDLNAGDDVSAGQEIGVVDIGGHASPGSLHLGVRSNGAYINPLLLFGEVPRAILLPCCGSF